MISIILTIIGIIMFIMFCFSAAFLTDCDFINPIVAFIIGILGIFICILACVIH